jgi:hypothetical protein
MIQGVGGVSNLKFKMDFGLPIQMENSVDDLVLAKKRAWLILCCGKTRCSQIVAKSRAYLNLTTTTSSKTTTTKSTTTTSKPKVNFLRSFF